MPYWVASPDDARKAVAELAANKVDVVKIWVDTRDGKYQKVTPAIYGAIIDEAHKRGLRVTAHIFAHRQRPQPEAVVTHVPASAVL